jgi:hypothetical protein
LSIAMDQPLMEAWSAITCWPRHWTLGPWMRPLLVDLPSPTSFRKSYHFQLITIVLRACSLLVDWDRTHIVERWTDTDQSLHLDTDQETIRNNLRRTSFDWWPTLYWASIDHFLLVMKSEIIFRDFPYIWLRFLPLSVYPRCLAARERIWSAGDLFFWNSSNHIRVASQSEQPRSPQVIKLLQNRSAVRAFYPAYQTVKPLQWRQILNHS